MTQDEASAMNNRRIAFEQFVSAIAAAPDMAVKSNEGPVVAKFLIEGTDTLMAYLREGKKP